MRAVKRAAGNRHHDHTSMEKASRIVGLAYVRRFGDPAARVVVEELERENARLRLRRAIVDGRDVRGALRRLSTPFRRALVLAVAGLLLALGYYRATRAVMDANDVKMEMVGDQVVSLSNGAGR